MVSAHHALCIVCKRKYGPGSSSKCIVNGEGMGYLHLSDPSLPEQTPPGLRAELGHAAPVQL